MHQTLDFRQAYHLYFSEVQCDDVVDIPNSRLDFGFELLDGHLSQLRFVEVRNHCGVYRGFVVEEVEVKV